jgi:hypothetical protein
MPQLLLFGKAYADSEHGKSTTAKTINAKGRIYEK